MRVLHRVPAGRGDLSLAALLLIAGELQVAVTGGLHGARWAVAVQTLGVIAVAWRRTNPLGASFTVALMGVANLAIDGARPASFNGGQIAAAFVVVYSVGAHETEPGLSIAGMLLVLGSFWCNDTRQDNPPSEYFASLLLIAGPWAAGVIIGRTVRQANALREANRELEVQRRRAREAAATAERERIARELHDIVAHSLSIISVQADAAGALMPVRPDDAERAIEAVRDTAHGALQEMRRLLGHVREPDGAGSPVAGPGGLQQLAAAARAAGDDVVLTVHGEPGEIPAAVTVSALRIVQEALTNARRHAPGAPCAVWVSYGPRMVRVRVDNDRPAGGTVPPPSPSGGFGLIGVGERVRALGGTLQTGPSESGGWTLHATLPLLPDVPGEAHA